MDTPGWLLCMAELCFEVMKAHGSWRLDAVAGAERIIDLFLEAAGGE